ncbi:MAG: lytic murein transglycosylase [Patescibacteria group bacterium]
MRKFIKPKVLSDISFRDQRAGKPHAFSSIPRRLNLGYRRVLRVSLVACSKLTVCVVAAIFLIVGSVSAPTFFTTASGAETDDERKALESQLVQLEKQINQYEGQVVGYQQQGKNLKGQITLLNDKIAKLNLQIQAVNLTLGQLNKKINETQGQIEVTEKSIEFRRTALGKLVQSLYENQQISFLEVLLKNPRLSDFFSNINNITIVQSNLRVAIEEITDLKNDLKDKEEQFSLARADAESVRAYQAAQKAQIDSTKQEKNKLLEVTKGQESRYQVLVKETKVTAAQIRSRIFQFLGGGELSFEDAYKYAKLAGGATGIRPALLLAVLDRESALGQNVGKCNYKTAMSPSNRPLFLEIVRELGINPDIVTVSCANRDGVYGGAMGPAQFIPSTWNIYKDSVAKVTGHAPSSPWNNGDAFVATALYLKDAMTVCSTKYTSDVSRERCVAAKYYAGGRWQSYLWTYGEAVVSRARSFQGDIDTITG